MELPADFLSLGRGSVITPDFLGITWVGLTQVLSDMG